MKAHRSLGRAVVLLLAGVCPAGLLTATAVRAQPPGFAYPPAPSLSSVNSRAVASTEPPLANPAPANPTPTAQPPLAPAVIAPGCGSPPPWVPNCPPSGVPYTGQQGTDNGMGGPTPPPGPDQNVNPGEEASGARGESETAGIVPNVIGDLLFTSRSVRFGFTRVNGDTDFLGLSSTTIRNSAVDENNSPVPEDRVYFRYNYYNNAQSVTGLSSTAPQVVPPQGAPPDGIFVQLPQTKNYDSNVYTFGVEKTFFDNLLSLELRVPVITGLASKNTTAVGQNTGLTGGTDTGTGQPTFNVVATPQDTLGQEDTEFGDITLVLKGLLYENRASGLYVSAGTGLTLPTGEDTSYHIIDFAGTGSLNGSPMASFERERDIVISNETSSLSPFLAVLYTPSDRLFTQGFFSVEVPLGSSQIAYADSYLHGQVPNTPASLPQNIVTPFYVTDRINEQTLLHLDWNIGFWAYRAPEARWLTGIAPCFEAHYTASLDKAQSVQLPGDIAYRLNPANPIASIQGNPQFPQVGEPGPVVGGQPSTVNIVDLTAGSTFLIGKNTTLATAFSVPVTNQTNRTFDWEFQLQLNYYFGR